MLARSKLTAFLFAACESLSGQRGIRMILRNAKLEARTIVSVAVTATLLGSMVGSGARAQDGSAQRSQGRPSDPRYDAPIGARQPRPQDLPPGVLRDEGHVMPSQRDFDKSLRICRPC